MPQANVKVLVGSKDLFSKTIPLPPKRISVTQRFGDGDPALMGNWRLDETVGSGSELVSNGGFETYTVTPGAPDSWTAIGAGAGVVLSKETAIVDAGVNACRVAVDWTLASLGSTHGAQQVIAGLATGKSYLFRARLHLADALESGVVAVCKIRNQTDVVDVTTGSTPPGLVVGQYANVSGTFFVDNAADQYLLQFGFFRSAGATGTDAIVLDSFSVQEIVASDASGRGNHGTLKGGTNTTGPTIGASAASGTAYDFDGTDDNVEFPDAFPTSPSLTVAVWATADQLRVQGLIDASAGTGVLWRIFLNSSNRLEFDANPGELGNAITAAITAGTEFFVVATFDGTTANIYLNGVLADSKTPGGTMVPSDTYMVRVAPSATNRWDGKVSEAMVFSRALAPSEVAMLYNGAYVSKTVLEERSAEATSLVGASIRRTGNRSAQSSTITVSNEDGDLWSDEFPARKPVTIHIDGAEVFDGYVDHIGVGAGNPGILNIECAGRTMRLRDSEVRPIVYDSNLDEDERDGPGVNAMVSGGQIELPTTPRFSPIDQLISVEVGGTPIMALNLDQEGGIIYVDQKYNGQSVVVNYTVFKEKYEAEDADDIIADLMDRHGVGFTYDGLEAVAVPITFEPGRASNLFVEIGRIRDYVGSYDFYLDGDDDLQFYQRSSASIAVVNKQDVRSASFNVDYSAYANKVTVRSNDGITNSISVAPGPFQNVIEGLNPTGTKVDQVAQGFKALDSSIMNFRVLAKRDTEEDLVDWEIQYNGRRSAISESFDVSHALTPDSTNITIDFTNDRIRVKANGSGVAYFSSDWKEDLNQDTESTVTSVTTTSNIYQTITVADLARKVIKGIAFKTATVANSVTFRIYSGSNGNTGTLLGTSEPVSLADTANRENETDWYAVYFADAVDVTAQTTISIVPNTDASTFAWQRSSTSVYAGGTAKNDVTDLTSDFTFQFFTVATLQDILAGFIEVEDEVLVVAKTPLYYIARNYSIGDPDSATWEEVLSNQPRLLQEGTGTANKFGIKVAFNSASLTTDPLIMDVKGAVAYVDATVALDEPSGVIVGDLFDTFGADRLPFYNRDSGTFTKPIDTDRDSRLEPEGNYWKVLKDGNQDDGGVSHFTVFYDDGASATYVEDWNDETAVSTSVNLDVSDSAAAIDRNAKVASLVTNDVLGPTANVIAQALITRTENLRGGRVFPMVSRNRRNYYDPERSATTTDAAANTGELLILQFDTGDFATVTATGSSISDQSGNGFNALVRTSAKNASGKYGGGINTASASYGSAHQGVCGVSPWMKADASFAFWFKPTAALADDRGLFAIAETAASPRINIMLSMMASGQVKLTHSYSNGASTETHTTDNTNSATVLTNGTWTHVAVARTGISSASIYFDGVLKNTFALTNEPDQVPTKTATRGAVQNLPDLILWFEAGGNLPNPPTGVIDDFRAWHRPVEDWVINHVKDYAYRSIGARFTFPAEADGTDTYTTADGADATMKNLRVAQFLWPSFNYEDGVKLRLGMDYSNAIGSAFGGAYTDLSSYAHVVTANAISTADLVDGSFGTAASLDGATEYLVVANDGNLHFGDQFTAMFYYSFVNSGNKQNFMHKRDAVTMFWASSAHRVDLECIGGVTRSLVAPTGVGGTNGTVYHYACRYDGTLLEILIDGAVVASQDFGSRLAVANSPNNLYIGANNPSGSTASTLFEGTLDEVILLDYVADNATVAAIDSDPSTGLRSPTQQGYTLAAYDGTSVRAYTDGKYLVTRDEGWTWVDTLDGSTSNPYGTLCFQMEFGKENLQCIRRDTAEIARAGIEVGKVFDVTAKDHATLCTIADGYLQMLSDGLAKGTLAMDGRTDWEVGDVLTINYPEKGQNYTEYAIATEELVISGDGDFSMRIELGEEERNLGNMFGTAEVGIA